MRVHLKGIASASFKLANGQTKKHYYAWRGGPAIKDGSEYLQPGDPRFIPVAMALIGQKQKSASTTFQTLIDLYLDSDEYLSCSERTRTDYRNLISARPDNIEKNFGKMPLSAFTEKNRATTRGIFKEWRDMLARRSRRQADYAWVVLARICSVAVDRGKIPTNPCEKGGRLYRADRSEQVWTDEDEQKFLASAPEHLRLAILLAIWTGQRQGDLLKLTWTAYDGQTIRFRQGKTRARITIPVGAPLKAALDTEIAKRRGTLILLTAAGTPWTPDGFRASWRKAVAKAGISGLTFHDLRGTAITRLAVAGGTVPEIAALTGHTLKDVESILDAHYLSRGSGLAESAIIKLEAHVKGAEKTKE
ncbi:Phage integrase family protein [Pseudoxanthobacter soli DSM 19599]|uniref:Phage integrase family protein n=1 Tax=Pseudoxanthobacter soli DSM 19599 TaxID=1123029 RepID=A0A1M7ZLT3_9HYPH|nr:site-specific integrase [Pseudoxanthobacter soli]SHO65855.1 Phage integrase family protein [Pseudoxanthobacter soli DSM 19599]